MFELHLGLERTGFRHQCALHRQLTAGAQTQTGVEANRLRQIAAGAVELERQILHLGLDARALVGQIGAEFCQLDALGQHAPARTGLGRRRAPGAEVRQSAQEVELAVALAKGLLPVGEVFAVLSARPAGLHVVATGRDAPPELIAAADLVTEMRDVKHPFRAGVPAQQGIEW